MRPGDERNNARAAGGDWEHLLEILRSADSPVGAAVHWVESHGGDGRGGASGTMGAGGKRRKVGELWRFVPELLASKIVYVEEEGDEEEEVESDTITERRGGRVANCIWMQTLPTAMQTNILTFLNVEHPRFHAKDLELLARCILNSPDADFWLFKSATTLLNTSLNCAGKSLPSPCKDKCTWSGMDDYDALPGWLHQYNENPNPAFPWLPIGQLSLGTEAKQHQQTDRQSDERVVSQLGVQHDTPGSSHHPLKWNADNSENKNAGADDIKTSTQESLKEKITTPSEHTHTNNDHMEDVHLDADSMELSQDDRKNLVSREELAARADLGDEVFSQAIAFRQTLHSCQPDELQQKIDFIRSMPKLSIFLSVVKAWEVEDEVTFVLIRILLTQQDGYTWSTQILRSVVLQKLLRLEKPASRLLLTALAQAGKIHPRATMDAVIFPLICSEKGVSSIHCEVINRVIKDSLPEEVNISLCEKMFTSWDEMSHTAIWKASWVWTEGVITVVHNLLSQKLNLDQRTISGIVYALDSAMSEFSASLKFGNLLLTFFTKYAPKLKSHKPTLQLMARRSNTFLTKSLLTKVSAL